MKLKIPYSAFFVIILGLIFIIVFCIILYRSGIRIGIPIDVELSAMVGTFIGGTVGVTWSFASFLLIYSALIYQKKEIEIGIKSNEDIKKSTNFQKFQETFFKLLDRFDKNATDLESLHIKTYLDFDENNENEDLGDGFTAIDYKFSAYLYKYGNSYSPSKNVSILESFRESKLKSLFISYGERYFQLLDITNQQLANDPSDILVLSLKKSLLIERTFMQISTLLLYSHTNNRLSDFLNHFSQVVDMEKYIEDYSSDFSIITDYLNVILTYHDLSNKKANLLKLH